MSEILVKVLRGETLESVHRGSFVVLDGSGETIAEIGDSDAVTFWRSAAKALQAIPLITSGAADAFGFTEKEIALACASHSGEKFHLKTVLQMLKKIGLEESDLRCGAHASFHQKTAEAMLKADEIPSQLNNNCSGKHAGMLALAKHIGADIETYLSPENAVQKRILRAVALFTEIPLEEIKLGIDGCSAPNFAVPLRSMAKGFAKLINPEESFAHEKRENKRKGKKEKLSIEKNGSEHIFSSDKLIAACKRIVQAQMKFPEYVGGSHRLDTKIMQGLPGKIISKVGAEGVWSAGILPCEKWKKGLGVAMKIEDGDDERARPACAIELLRQLGVMTDEAESILAEYSPMVLKNRRDVEVGKVEAAFKV